MTTGIEVDGERLGYSCSIGRLKDEGARIIGGRAPTCTGVFVRRDKRIAEDADAGEGVAHNFAV